MMVRGKKRYWGLAAIVGLTLLGATRGDTTSNTAAKPTAAVVPDATEQGEPASIVQIANLVYAGTKSSQCFSDHFLIQAEQETAISTSRRFHAVKLSSDELYHFPLAIMTGEGEFVLPDQERDNLRWFVERGGLLLASAGCSSAEWDRSFRNEMAKIFPDASLVAIGMDHPVFHTAHDVSELKAKHGRPKPLEGVTLGGRLGVIYSQDGLNDTQHTQGCCCCGGNEIINSAEVNINILAYALTY
ncbi:MAG TPA: DUF4159 domain-containing protein [Pirellulales bacterium]|nr:DUF4159 domain-containing protein [Pirellulales bacterium]